MSFTFENSLATVLKEMNDNLQCISYELENLTQATQEVAEVLKANGMQQS